MIWFIFQTITVVSADGITAVNKTVKLEFIAANCDIP